MKRIYVAGPYSANNVLEILNNMRRGMRASTEIFLMGFAVFCPWLDYQFSLMLQNNEKLTLEDYYKYSIAWLEVSDALYILPNSENSLGTQNEIEIAKKLNIPIYYDMEKLCELLSKEERII